MAKDVFLIRHGQSTFNVLYEASGVDPLHFDAPLSELGAAQVADSRCAAETLGVELVVTSPLMRALETAMGLFGAAPVPILVSSLHRERLANSCDIGKPPAVLSETFPTLDFGHLDETWWHDGEADHRGVAVEPDTVFMGRVEAFTRWIAARPEHTVAVVGHGTFFHRMTGRHLENCEVIRWRP